MALANAANGRTKYAGGQSTVGSYQQMTDSGEQKVFTVSGGNLWSGRSGFEPTFKPDGILSITGGGFPLTTNAADDTLTVAGGKCQIGGAEVPWTATTVTITRGGIGTEYRKNSVIVNSSGVVSVIQADGHVSAYSDVRGADGGPATLTPNTVELGQTATNSDTVAVILSAEINQNPSANQAEWATTLNYEQNNIGIGLKSSFPGADSAKQYAFIEFSDALEVSHGASPSGAATTARAVWISYSTDNMSNAQYAKDWNNAANSVALSSTQFMSAVRGSSATTLNSGSFVYSPPGNPVDDPLLVLEGEILTFDCYPDKNQTQFYRMQGVFTAATTMVVEGVYESTITVVPETAAAGFLGV